MNGVAMTFEPRERAVLSLRSGKKLPHKGRNGTARRPPPGRRFLLNH